MYLQFSMINLMIDDVMYLKLYKNYIINNASFENVLKFWWWNDLYYGKINSLVTVVASGLRLELAELKVSSLIFKFEESLVLSFSLSFSFSLTFSLSFSFFSLSLPCLWSCLCLCLCLCFFLSFFFFLFYKIN